MIYLFGASEQTLGVHAASGLVAETVPLQGPSDAVKSAQDSKLPLNWEQGPFFTQPLPPLKTHYTP